MTTLADVAAVLNDAFAGRLADIAHDPDLARHQCGPLTLAALRALREAGYRCGAWFLTGTPDGVETAHYVCVVTDDDNQTAVVDVSYRQFDPDSLWPLMYAPADFGRYGWTDIEGDMFDDMAENSFRWTYDCFDETPRQIHDELWTIIGPPIGNGPVEVDG